MSDSGFRVRARFSVRVRAARKYLHLLRVDRSRVSAAAFDVTTVAAGDECPSGGERIKVGVDGNRNGTLDASEVSNSYLTCNGSSDADAPTPLVVTEQEPAGKHCKNGGLAAETGNESDGDRRLTGEELEETE